MYRCPQCDHPAQMGHDEACPADMDPWGWVEEEAKLDIQSGVRVKTKEHEEE